MQLIRSNTGSKPRVSGLENPKQIIKNSITLNRLSQLDRPAVAAFGLPFILYLWTLAPTIYNLDSAELTTAAATGGIVRATGYPLYTALGWLWAQVPLGDVGYRLNLMSAFFGAATVLLAELILRRLKVGGWARFGALALLAVAPYFWVMSLVAEVYTLHTALMAGVILSLMFWADRPTPQRLMLPVVLMTLSMGNHVATVLLVPGAVWFVASSAPRQLLKPRNWLAVVAGVLLGAAIFLYLPLRYGAGPAFNYAGEYNAAAAFQPVDLGTWEGFTWLITGRTFAGQMFGYALFEIPSQAWGFVQHLGQSFFFIGLGPGLLGAVLLLRRDPRTGIMLLLMFGANAIFYINYRVVDKATMYLPAYLVWALWLGIGFQALLGWLAKQTSPGKRSGRRAGEFSQLPERLLMGVIILTVLIALAWNYPRANRGQDWSARERGEAILSEVDKNAVVFGYWDTVPVIEYLQLVEGERPDVLAVNRFLMPGEAMETFILKEVKNRPIYIDNPPFSLIEKLDLSREGTLYRLEPRQEPLAQPGIKTKK